MRKTSDQTAAAESEVDRLRQELDETRMTLDAIRTGQVDALLVESVAGPQLFTLNSADQAYRFFIEEMKEGAITLSKEGLILFCNGQFASLVGLPVDKILGKKLVEFIFPQDVSRCEEMQRLCWVTPGKAEFLLQRQQDAIPVQFSMIPIGLAEAFSLSVLVTDLTERKATENILKQSNEKLLHLNAALEASNHDLQQFASVASHDLQEPVRKIQIFSMMLRDQEGQLSPDGKKLLAKVITSANRMKLLIVDILNYSALSSGDQHFVNIPLSNLIESLVEDYELVIRQVGARIIVDPMPEILANPGQIRQVFQNLLSNALKFIRPDIEPEIRITCERVSQPGDTGQIDPNGPYRRFSVSDNGIGFEVKYAPNIFSLFERLNGKDKFEGTGIGLAIAKKIVEKHGGSITARSSPGSGSVFTFFLPIVPLPPQSGDR